MLVSFVHISAYDKPDPQGMTFLLIEPLSHGAVLPPLSLLA